MTRTQRDSRKEKKIGKSNVAKYLRIMKSHVSGVRSGRNLPIMPKDKLDFLIISMTELLQKPPAFWSPNTVYFFGQTSN